MIRGLYTSASGMLAESVRNDVTANNLANANTTGYKKDTAIIASFPDMLLYRLNDQRKGEVQPPAIGKLGTGALVDEVITDHGEGQLKETSSFFDLAIAGDGYFTVETPAGQRYTRNGSFSLNRDGYLVTNQGYYVLGQAGRIRADGEFKVDNNGNVFVNGGQTDTLRIVTFADPRQLTKIGDTLFTAAQQGDQTNARVVQKYLETSNINPITEMVNMIAIMRAYEANQKAIQAHDSTLDKAVNSVGSVK